MELSLKTDYPKLSIKKGREWHLLRGHPWLFSGGISQAPKKIEAGNIVRLLDCDGKFVATGYYNPNCDIAVRVLSRDADQEIDEGFIAGRLGAAWSLRQQCLDLQMTNVFRVVNAEGDFLPGFIVDYYDGTVVVQCHTAGADVLLEKLISALKRIISPRTIILRNDASARHREGLQIESPRVVYGEIADELLVKENGLRFVVDPMGGQKTGYFTDHRDKREAIAKYASRLSKSAKLLNCFSYTCSFSVYACAANSHLSSVNVDQSQHALELGKKNLQLNSIDPSNHDFHEGDAFAFMERQISSGTKYDITILDPPAFAKTHKDKEKALKGYSRMTSLGLRVTNEEGLLVVCSCSGAVSLEDFIECTRQACGNSGKFVQLLEVYQHGFDHPVNLMAQEGLYLKVLFCRVLNN